MLPTQGVIRFSEHSALYDIVVKKNNKWRRLNDMTDYSFVYDELKDRYCPDNGRMAEDPVRMFKYLMIKSILGVSDADLVEHCMTDMALKFFLGLVPEDNVIDSTTLTKFRRQRLREVSILDKLICKSVEIARSKGIDISRKIIVDSTHTLSRSNPTLPAAALQKQARILRKAVYDADASQAGKLPEKYEGADLEKTMDYMCGLLSYLKEQRVSFYPVISEKMNLLSEMMDDITDHYTLSSDSDARIGHKAADTEFFGYKGHLAVTPERIVVAATMTSGEKGDGPELPELIRKAKENIPDLEEVVGDGAYSGQNNLECAEREGVELVAKLHPIVARGTRENDAFSFNKDAGMMVCPAGHMAVMKVHHKATGKSKNERFTYHFDILKCRRCKHAALCGYKKGQNTKTYTITMRTEQQERQLERQRTEEFRQKYGIRYIIEAKNSELKHSYHLDKAISYGLDAYTLQGAVALFTSNLVRINRILDQKGE